MAIEKFRKQPYEEFPIGADFSANFATDTVILSQTVSASDRNGDDATNIVTNQSSIVNDGASIVNVTVLGGDPALSPYKITFKIVDSVNSKWELDVKMEVKEI